MRLMVGVVLGVVKLQNFISNYGDVNLHIYIHIYIYIYIYISRMTHNCRGGGM
jgi:hypothetical protein